MIRCGIHRTLQTITSLHARCISVHIGAYWCILEGVLKPRYLMLPTSTAVLLANHRPFISLEALAITSVGDNIYH